MISDDKANIIADDLLDQMRAQRRPTQAPVLLFYRSPELMALEPGLRAAVIGHAFHLLRTDPKVILALVLYCGAAIAFLFTITTARVLPLGMIAVLPVILVRNLLVRRTARRLAAELQARG